MRITVSLLNEHCDVISESRYLGGPVKDDFAGTARVLAGEALIARGFRFNHATQRFYGDESRLPAYIDVEHAEWAPGGNQVTRRRSTTYRLSGHLVAVGGVLSASGAWHHVTSRQLCWALAAA